MRFKTEELLFAGTVLDGSTVFTKDIDLSTGRGICFNLDFQSGFGNYEIQSSIDRVTWYTIPGSKRTFTGPDSFLAESQGDIYYDYVRVKISSSSGDVVTKIKYSEQGF